MRSTMQQMLSSVALAVCLLAFLAASALASPGELDSTLTTGAGFDGTVTAIAQQADGKFVVGGLFTHYESASTPYLARLNQDGTLDRTFATATGLNGTVEAIVIQLDGRIVIGGSFTTAGGEIRNSVARFNVDGTLDAGYSANPFVSGFTDAVYALALQPDGKVVVGGAFLAANGIAFGSRYNRVARLGTDGTVDTAFYPTGDGLDGNVATVAIQPDGKALIGGAFTMLQGVSVRRVARLNTDGAMDSSFRQPGDGVGFGLNSDVQRIVLQPDGKVLVSGLFTAYGGVARAHIARLTNSGGLDTSFDPGVGLVGSGFTEAPALAVLPTGKVFVGGQFDTANGIARTNGAQLNADGSLDTGFAIGTGFGSTVHVAAIAADGRLLAGGDFASYNGTARGHFARILDSAALTVAEAGAGTGAVTSAPSGIACGTTCSAAFDQASSVTLTATAAAGSTFTGWGGACSGTSATCVVTMSAAVAVTATFALDSAFKVTPDSAFTVTKVKAKTSAGRIFLTSTITVPGGGAIEQTATTKKGKKLTTRCSTKRVASKAGTYKLTCTIGKRGRAALRKVSLALTIRTAFTPTNGSLAAETQALKVKRFR